MKTLKSIVESSVDMFENYYASEDQNLKISENIKTEKLKVTEDCIEYVKEKNYDPMVIGIFSYSAIAPNGSIYLEINKNYDYVGRMLLSVSTFLRKE